MDYYFSGDFNQISMIQFTARKLIPGIINIIYWNGNLLLLFLTESNLDIAGNIVGTGGILLSPCTCTFLAFAKLNIIIEAQK